MKKSKILCFFAVLSVIFTLSCTFGPYPFSFDSDVDDRVKSVVKLGDENLPLGKNWGDGEYSFLIVTDMHFGAKRYTHHDEAFYDWIRKAFQNSDKTQIPRFIVNLGDIADTGSSSQYKDYNQWCDKVRTIAVEENIVEQKEDFRIYNVIGNHDLYKDGQKNYKKYVWPYIYSYYFEFAHNPAAEGFGFYFLDSGNGTFGVHQFKSMKKVMEASSKKKLVFTHYPIYGNNSFVMVIQDSLERAKVLSLFSANSVKLIEEGHAHRTDETDFNGTMLEQLTASYANFDALRLITVNEADCTVSTQLFNF